MNADFEKRWSAAMELMQAMTRTEREAVCADTLRLANKTGVTTAGCFIAVMESLQSK